MNSVKGTIRERLGNLPNEIAAVASACTRYLNRCCAIDLDDSLLIAHRPWEGPHSYLCRIFPPAKQSWIPRYQRLHDFRIPKPIQRILLHANGLNVFGLCIYGIAPSMVESPPVLRRSVVQCLDISEANSIWKHEYASTALPFHFGAREFSDTELLGYFLDDAGTVTALRKSGELLGKWTDFATFLRDELSSAETFALASIEDDWWD